MSIWTSDEIRKLRLRYGESQDVFCKRFRVTPTAFRNWEQGRFAPTGPIQELLDRLKEDLEEGKIRELVG